MRNLHRTKKTGAWVAALMLTSGLVMQVAAAAESKAPKAEPASCSFILVQAATALADGRLEDAQAAFQNLATGTNAPPFVRGLAQCGLVQR